MSKFKVGDKVRIINAGFKGIDYNPSFSIGEALIVDEENTTPYCLSSKGVRGAVRESVLELISEPIIKTFMSSIIEKAKLAFKAEPQKSFQKAGITDSSDNLTAEGKELFLYWLFQKNGAEFKTEVVDLILAEEK